MLEGIKTFIKRGKEMNEIKNTCLNQEKPYIFISYSHADENRVYPILSQLGEYGYRFWYDRNIESGSKWADDISEWLTHENCIKFVVFISKQSMHSENVQDEVHIARKYNKSCLVVYLEDVNLSGGMELQLDRWQRINWHENSEDIAIQMLMKGIPNETIEVTSLMSDSGDDFSKKYHLLEVIGNGGSSTVYKARAIATDALVTIKVAKCNSKDENTRNYLIQNEKIALSKIHCPFIPQIIDFGEGSFKGESRYYLVESFIPGQTLAQIRCPLNEAEIIMIILDICRTLQYLHTNGMDLVHSDIKPENIIIDQYNQSYLIDFGGCVKNNSHVFWGTTTFAAPEQNRGENIDIRSDIYSLGVTMKYLIEKENLSTMGISFKENLNRSVTETVPNISRLLALIVDKMVDPRMEKRFQTVEDLIFTLDEYRQKVSEPVDLILQKNNEYINTKYGTMALSKAAVDGEVMENTEIRRGVQFVSDPLPIRNDSAVYGLSISVVRVTDRDSTREVQLPPTPSIITVGI